MKMTIEVSSREEGDLIRRGFDDPAVRAFVRIMGTLLELPTDEMRHRVLGFIEDSFPDTPEES